MQGPSLLFICIAALSLIDIRRLPHLQPHILVTGRKKQSSKKKKEHLCQEIQSLP